jgi:N-succinyldiaminopimelate aminotransferase
LTITPTARIAERISGFNTTVFAEMTALANQHGAINLGQGFPDFPAPDFIKQAAVDAIHGDVNQYAPGMGTVALREAIAAKIERHYGLTYDPASEIGVSVGATEAIAASIMGLVNPGDEVILFEPYYDSYVPSVTFAGGIPKFYTLHAPDWCIDPDQLAALFSDKTKLIVINTPHNPSGKVFTREELQLIADLCQRFDVIALTDEVYEHILFDAHQHIPMASLPGMRERTLTLSSIGKTFSVTGWKVGWAIGPADLVRGMFRVRQFLSFCGAAPLQHASITALQVPDGYYADLRAFYQSNRDFLIDGLRAAGLKPLTPAGTYFVMIDISDLGFSDDVAFCKHLTANVGVAAIPPSAFYSNPADGAGLARFAFCKSRQTLTEAVTRMKTRL